MELSHARFINPFTDYGFKRIFGEEANKDLLIDFLNVVIPQKYGSITDLTYLNTERLGLRAEDRKAVYDLYCKTESGARIVIELQKAEQKHFKERTLFYNCIPIRDQAIRGKWDYNFDAVYLVGVLDFIFAPHKEKLLHPIMYCDIEDYEIYSEKSIIVLLESPKFTKTVDELETKFDKWLYLLKNLSILEKIPEKIREKIFG